MIGEHAEQLLFQAFTWMTTNGVIILLIAGAMVLGFALLKRGLARLQRLLAGTMPDQAQLKRANTLTHVLGDVCRVLILVVGSVTILSEMGVDVGPILMTAGIGGIAIGFGAQTLVKDVISGFFILLENQIRVGDVVTAAGTTALVEEVRLRTTRMRDLAGNYHVIPNGMIDKVTNWTKEFSYALFDLGVAYREDVDEVMGLIESIGQELQRDPEFAGDILEPLEMLGVDKFADSAVIIKFRIKTRPIRQWAVMREMNRRIKKAFDVHGIEIPFPHRTLYWGVPKEGAAPPLHVAGWPFSTPSVPSQ